MENKTPKIDTIDMAFKMIKLPSFCESLKSSKPYVPYGEDNKWPILLQSLANNSALHNAILVSKLDYSYGNGLFLYGDNLATQLFVEHPNGTESLNDIYKKCLYDYILYGSFSLNVIWSNDGESIAELYHLPVDKIRSGKKNEYGIVENYYYSNDWYKATPRYKAVSSFDISNRIGNQIMYCNAYRPGQEYYSLPSYTGSLNWIAVDCEISNFHLSHLENGMAPSYLITFTNGIPSPEERQKYKRKFEEAFCGTDNTGKFILSYTDDPDKKPQVDNLTPDNLDKQFIQLEESVLQNILAGHQVVSPSLVGIKSDGISFGSGEEIKNAYTLFNDTVINNIQNFVADKFNYLLRYTRLYDGKSVLKPTKIDTFSDDK